MSFKHNDHIHTLRGLHVGSPTIISSHRMERLLKKRHHGVVTQFNAIQAFESTTPHIHPEMHQVLDRHQRIFDKLKELPPSRGEHDHNIPLVMSAQPPNVFPYRYPFAQKNEIEKIIKELLEASVIHPNISPYSYSVVMVLNTYGEWCMCLDFPAFNKLTIKEKFPILVIDDILDELHGAQFFTKLDLRSSYHQLHMKDVKIPKTTF